MGVEAPPTGLAPVGGVMSAAMSLYVLYSWQIYFIFKAVT